MIKKPEVYIGLDMYGQRTLQAYQWLIEDVDLSLIHISEPTRLY